MGWPSNWLMKGQLALGQTIKLPCALLDQSLHLTVGVLWEKVSIKKLKSRATVCTTGFYASGFLC